MDQIPNKEKAINVLIFCVKFWELSHLTGTYLNPEKKLYFLQAEQIHKMTSNSLKIVKVIILSENSCHFVGSAACKTVISFSA